MNKAINLILISAFFLSFKFSIISQITPQFNPIPPNFNVNSSYPVYAQDIAYDSTDINAQRFHLFLPDTIGNFPLIIYIHGGGFIANSPDIVLQSAERMQDIKYCLENGFAYASIGYRLINSNGIDNEGVIKCLNDAKRGLQFIRYYHDDLKINPSKIALQGSSAGASTSYWLGVRSNMADPNSGNPIFHESTRVCAVYLSGSQASLDYYKWETDVFQNFDGNGTNFTLDSMENLMGFERASNFYGGFDSIQQILTDPSLIQYRQNVDHFFHISADDPPIYIRSQSSAQHPSQDLFHHAFHGREIQNSALSVGISEVKADIPALNINSTNNESGIDFLIRHLNNCSTFISINDLNPVESTVTVFPNPVVDRFTLRGNSSYYHVEILDAMGQIKDEIRNIANGQSIDISWLQNGVYFIRLKNKSNTPNDLIKFIKI